MTEPAAPVIHHTTAPVVHDAPPDNGAPAILAGVAVEMVLVWYDLLPIPAHFQISSITNTTYYLPGERMTREVAQMCSHLPHWNVRMLDNNVLSTLLSTFLSLPKFSIPMPTL